MEGFLEEEVVKFEIEYGFLSFFLLFYRISLALLILRSETLCVKFLLSVENAGEG